MEEDIGVEPNYIRVPYQFRSRLSCPFSLDNIEEGEHHVPRTFQSFSNGVRHSSPSISLVPLQVSLHDSSDESVLYSEDSFENEGNFSLTELSWPEQLDFSAFSADELPCKVSEMYTRNPDGMVNVLENLLNQQNNLKLLVLELLGDFYAKHDAPLYHRLRNVYVQGHSVYSCARDIQDLIAAKRNGLLNIQTKQQGIKYYTEQLRFLMSKSGGLSSSMF